MQSLTSVMTTLKKATKTMIVKSHTIGNRTSADAAPDGRKGRTGKKPSSLDSLEGRNSCGVSTSLRSLPNTHRPQLSPLDVSEFGQVTSLSYGEPDASGDVHSYWDEPVHPSSIALWRNDVEMAIPDVGVDEVPLSPPRHLVSLPLPSSPSVTSSASMRAQYHASPQRSNGLPDDAQYTSYGPDAYLWVSSIVPPVARPKADLRISCNSLACELASE